MRSSTRLALALLVAAALAAPARAGEVQLIEQKIKAGLLYNFLKYTQWPAAPAGQANPTLVVCLIGGDPFDGHLQPMAGRTVNERTIEIRNVKAAEIAPCSMLVVHETQKSAWPQLREALAGKHVLTVSDFEGFTEAGGMIEFNRVDNRVNVELNTDAVAAAHIQVQDRLLKLASVIHSDPR